MRPPTHLLLALVLGLAIDASTVHAQAPTRSPVPQARAVLDLMVKQDFAAAVAKFDAEMQLVVSEEKLRELWAGVLQDAGEFQSIQSDRAEPRGSFQAAILRAAFARDIIDFTIVMGTDDRVAGFSLAPAGPSASADATAAGTSATTPPAVAAAKPPYADPSKFTERAMTIGSGEFALPGTLTLPAGKGPFPAVVLVHGSGRQDRDFTVGPNKPFRDLAHGLASRGIAVLRYDKRTFVHFEKTVPVASFTVKDETIDDAVLAIEALERTPEVAADRVFVIGHSLGAMLAPRIAGAVPGIAGFVLLAGSARPIDQAAVEQIEYVAGIDGSVSPAEQEAIDEMRATAERVQRLSPGDQATILGAPAAYWLDLRGYDAPQAAAAIRSPMLVLQGERDFNVTMAEFERWKAALGGRTDVTFKSYPALNHLFMSGTGPITPAEYSVESHVDGQVVFDVAGWIEQARKP